MLQVKGFDKNCCSNLVTQIHVIMEKVCFISHPFTHEAFE